MLQVSGRLHPLSLQCQIDGRCAYLSIVNLSVAANRMLHPVSDEPSPPWLPPVAHFDRYAPRPISIQVHSIIRISLALLQSFPFLVSLPVVSALVQQHVDRGLNYRWWPISQRPRIRGVVCEKSTENRVTFSRRALRQVVRNLEIEIRNEKATNIYRVKIGHKKHLTLSMGEIESMLTISS